MLIVSKSRVALTETQSLPRLKLCEAVLLVRLMKNIFFQRPFQPGKIQGWTDLKSVDKILAWLDKHSSTW